MSTLDRGRRAVLAVVGAAALMAVGGLVATALVKSPAQVAAETGPPVQRPLTAEVEQRVLATRVVMRGTVTADQSVAVSPQGMRSGEGAGAAVVTKLPLKAGDAVTAGQLLAEVSGRPVFALHGGLPMYRDLRPGATGDDVAQLQQALRALGHDPGGDAKGVFGPGTKAALRDRYKAIGYEPLPAVADGGAALKAARDAVRSAEWAVEDAEAQAAGAQGSGAQGAGAQGSGVQPGEADAGKPAAGTQATPATATAPTAEPAAGSKAAADAGARELARARQALVEARAALRAAEAADGPMLPASEAVFLSGFPARVGSIGAQIGAPVTGAVLTVSAGELVVEAYLKDDKKQLLRAGMPVVISSEAVGTDLRGKVALVAAERSSGRAGGAQQGQGGGSQDAKGGGSGPGGGSGAADLGHRMVVRAEGALPAALAGQDVRLTVESAATDGAALVVPVTAVSAGADGRTVVTAVAPDGSAQHRVEVRTGTTGDGFVSVTPTRQGALAPGTRVVVGTTAGPRKEARR
ncbi:peptidoglycan-binding domain-containing protein [Streptomyces sp. NPDC032472]|uniref:peptidoglycan-binding domain-containing protein n=1 Tax=Streptomyces sp. NPDC032472 TaxID=3155018 RepID=UPI0033CBD9C7